ncbi:MAG: DUF5989 family protein [Elusimicrobiota bacterium]
MGRVRDAVRRMGVVGDLLAFLWRERLWWMIPMLIALILVALLVILGSNPAVAPFVYVLF